jgi:hypothetical protein
MAHTGAESREQPAMFLVILDELIPSDHRGIYLNSSKFIRGRRPQTPPH